MYSLHIKNNFKRSVLLNFIILNVEKYLQMTVCCFFTAFSQTDAHFDPDIADNAKQRNRSHHETIPLVFGHIHVRWLISN